VYTTEGVVATSWERCHLVTSIPEEVEQDAVKLSMASAAVATLE
jgi:hypothetical protein